MMVTDFRCWWQNHYVGDFFRYVSDFLNVLNRSPTSQTCHQHIWSPTSVTNIDVTIRLLERVACLGNQTVVMLKLLEVLKAGFRNKNVFLFQQTRLSSILIFRFV